MQKVLDKVVLLSNIPVHQEQQNKKCVLFDPHDPKQLAETIARTARAHPCRSMKPNMPVTWNRASQICTARRESTRGHLKGYFYRRFAHEKNDHYRRKRFYRKMRHGIFQQRLRDHRHRLSRPVTVRTGQKSTTISATCPKTHRNLPTYLPECSRM